MELVLPLIYVENIVTHKKWIHWSFYKTHFIF